MVSDIVLNSMSTTYPELSCKCKCTIEQIKPNIMFTNSKLDKLKELEAQINGVENYIIEIEGTSRPKFYNPQGFSQSSHSNREGVSYTDFLTPISEMKEIVLQNAKIKLRALKSEFEKLIK